MMLAFGDLAAGENLRAGLLRLRAGSEGLTTRRKVHIADTPQSAPRAIRGRSW